MGPEALMLVNIIGNYCCTGVLLYARMQTKTKNGETRLFCQIFFIDGISIKSGGLLVSFLPGYASDLTSMLFVILRFCALLCLFACQNNTYGFILYDHAKYVISLVKVKIVLNSIVVEYTLLTFLQFLIVLKLIFFCTNNCGMIPWFSQR